MPYRVTLAEGSIAVEFDTPEEGVGAYEAVRHLVRYLGPARALDALPLLTPPPQDLPPEDEPPPGKISKVYGGSGVSEPCSYHQSISGTDKGRNARMLAWYRALQEIDANAAGLSGDALSRRLRLAGPT